MIEKKPDYIDLPQMRKLFCGMLDLLKSTGRTERKRRVTIPRNRKYFKDFFEKGAYDFDVLWNLLKKCRDDGLIFFEEDKSRRDPDIHDWMKYKYIFNEAYEDRLRDWLDYHVLTPEEKEWREALEKNRHLFEFPDKLKNPVRSLLRLEKPAEEILLRLASVPGVLKEKPVTVYQLSAMLFWGHSKVFINQEGWLKEVFSLPDGIIAERPILIEISFPLKPPEGVLMIENLDCYISSCGANLKGCENLIKVYTQGFRGTSLRIRNEKYSWFHVKDPVSLNSKDYEAFVSFWQSDLSFPYPVYFFGDLDWAGMEIFCSLKKVFPEILPWKRGYMALMDARDNGQCHLPEMASKRGQKKIESTGDKWLDENILKPMKDRPLFVDQEIIC